ncbi:unnamed protein product [Candidula unifasciata]|uniref:G-protein coupled receptors family 1 profile domain-containing protein n=1 Tax=Candidula unifasciata TaxID=100452 RepID=A0A8S3ZAU7_9EUPU|nr:unnamed protein product [Candidula unifasciata]
MHASTLEIVANVYMSVHGVLSLIVCAFGIPMNVLNITILTRKHMHTPVNCILTWLAVFDLLTMISYVPFSLHFYCLTWNLSAERNSLGWMTFLIFHVDFTLTTHTISIWLGVTLAVFRYKHIFSPAKGHLTRVRRLIRARIAVFSVVVLSVLLMIPNYLMNQLQPYLYFNPETNQTEVIYVNEPLNLETTGVKPLAQVNLLLHSALAKFLPCILMVVYSGLLLKTLRTNIRLLTRRPSRKTSQADLHSCASDPSLPPQQSDPMSSSVNQTMDSATDLNTNLEELTTRKGNENLCVKCSSQIQGNTSASSSLLLVPKQTAAVVKSPKHRNSATSQIVKAVKIQPTRHQDNSRTTRMLLVVITLFLVTELPQAILIVLSATIPGFFLSVYVPLGDMMDMVALVNNGINFLLYCIMSRDFRTTLLDMLKSVINTARDIPGRLRTKLQRSAVTGTQRTQQTHTILIVTTLKDGHI